MKPLFFLIASLFILTPAVGQKKLSLKIAPGLQIPFARFEKGTKKTYIFTLNENHKFPSFGLLFHFKFNDRYSLFSGAVAGSSGWGYRIVFPNSKNPIQSPESASYISNSTYRFPLQVDRSFRQHVIGENISFRLHSFAGVSLDLVTVKK